MAKPFAWSWSKLKNFRVCPKRHYEVDIAKNIQEPESEQLKHGNLTHKALAKACNDGSQLPVEMLAYQRWVERVRSGPGEIYTEQQYAIRRDFSKTSWYAPDAWCRCIGDVVKINGRVAMVLDWKTGKVLNDTQQLALMAQCIFSHFPEVTHVRSVYVWLAEDCETYETYTREDMAELWAGLLDEVKTMEMAYDKTNYPAQPGRLCRRWCPVTTCEYHGKPYA